MYKPVCIPAALLPTLQAALSAYIPTVPEALPYRDEAEKLLKYMAADMYPSPRQASVLYYALTAYGENASAASLSLSPQLRAFRRRLASSLLSAPPVGELFPFSPLPGDTDSGFAQPPAHALAVARLARAKRLRILCIAAACLCVLAAACSPLLFTHLRPAQELPASAPSSSSAPASSSAPPASSSTPPVSSASVAPVDTGAVERDTTVYITTNYYSGFFHADQSCDHLPTVDATTTAQLAANDGYSPCPFCVDTVNFSYLPPVVDPLSSLNQGFSEPLFTPCYFFAIPGVCHVFIDCPGLRNDNRTLYWLTCYISASSFDLTLCSYCSACYTQGVYPDA